MENKRGNEIFLGVIGVATLLVAIIGATFAFFSATANSADGAITAQGAQLSLGYDDNTTLLKSHLIPSEDNLAHFSTTEAHHGNDTSKICIDDNGNEICSYYTFNVGNPSFTTKQWLYGKLIPATNDMTNLWFLIMDEKGNVVVQPTHIDGTEPIELSQLNQQLDPTNESAATALSDSFDSTKPSTYPKVCDYATEDCSSSNVRTYTLVLWIKEAHHDQTGEDADGKTFAAAISFNSGSDSSGGVTGVIAAAESHTIPSSPSTGE